MQCRGFRNADAQRRHMPCFSKPVIGSDKCSSHGGSTPESTERYHKAMRRKSRGRSSGASAFSGSSRSSIAAISTPNGPKAIGRVALARSRPGAQRERVRLDLTPSVHRICPRVWIWRSSGFGRRGLGWQAGQQRGHHRQAPHPWANRPCGSWGLTFPSLAPSPPIPTPQAT